MGRPSRAKRSARINACSPKRVVASKKRIAGDELCSPCEPDARERFSVTHAASTSSHCAQEDACASTGMGCRCRINARTGACDASNAYRCPERSAAFERAKAGEGNSHRSGQAYVAGAFLSRTPHQAERLLTLRVFYPCPRRHGVERVRDVFAVDFLSRQSRLANSKVRCRAMHARTSYKSRFELVRSATARYLVDGGAFAYAARNPNTNFLVTGVDTSLTMKPLIPYMVSWKDGDTESCMDGELIERLDAAEAGRDFFNTTRKRKWTLEKPRILRSADALTNAPTTAYELFAGTGEVAVKIANTFPWLKEVYAFEIDARIVCKAARDHARVIIVKCDLRTLRYLHIPRGAFVWCSPPCTMYSPQKRSHYSRLGAEYKTRALLDADTYVAMCLDFVRAARATSWVIENPFGELRLRDDLWRGIDHVVRTTSYCKYGARYRKVTDFFMSVELGDILDRNGGLRAKCTPCVSPCVHLRSADTCQHPERAAGRSARELARVPTALVGRILRAGVSNVLSIEHGVSR